MQALSSSSGSRVLIVLALLTVYLVWGTTYLAIVFALESYPPYLMMAIRFLIAGSLMFIYSLARGYQLPPIKQWVNGGGVGILLFVGGMGSVALAEETVYSGLVATLIASSPLVAVLFSMLWGDRPSITEWVGIVIGMVGVSVLTLEGNLQANPIGIGLVLFAIVTWSFGSVWSKHIDMPEAPMGTAVEMLVGGIALTLVAVVRSEQIVGAPTLNATLALIYLITFGSILTLTAYMYLLKHVKPSLALSYAYINPAIALLLGVFVGGEEITGSAWIALPLIITGVAFVAYRKQQAVVAPEDEAAADTTPPSFQLAD